MDDQTLIAAAVSRAHLSSEGKQQLLHLLTSNPKVCTHQLGRTTVLQHRLYTTHPVPIKQWAYRLTPEKQAVVKEQLKEMLGKGHRRTFTFCLGLTYCVGPQKRWKLEILRRLPKS